MDPVPNISDENERDTINDHDSVSNFGSMLHFDLKRCISNEQIPPMIIERSISITDECNYAC